MKRKRIVALLLLVISISLIVFPLFQSNDEMKKQEYLLGEVKQELKAGKTAIIKMDNGEKRKGVILKINSIAKEQVVLNGFTLDTIDVTLGAYTGNDGAPGKGNYAVAGHRSFQRGKNFNRLGEVKIGDTIDVIDHGKKYRYDVYNIEVIKETDVDILNPIDKDDIPIITLITCDPLYAVTTQNRLVVQGRLTEEVAYSR